VDILVNLKKPPRTKVGKLTKELLAEHQIEEIRSSLRKQFAKL
jgi:hypothetical protein